MSPLSFLCIRNLYFLKHKCSVSVLPEIYQFYSYFQRIKFALILPVLSIFYFIDFVFIWLFSSFYLLFIRLTVFLVSWNWRQDHWFEIFLPFLIKAFETINFSVNIALDTSHTKFDILRFDYYSVQYTFWFALRFTNSCESRTHRLYRSTLLNFKNIWEFFLDMFG